MHDLIAQNRTQIAALCRRYGVHRLEVFGSAARGTDFDPARSDADFLVEFEPGNDLPFLQRYFGLQEALAQLLGRSVDLVEPSAVRNPYLRQSPCSMSWGRPEMNAERLLALYERIADAPDAIARLRRFVLDLAVRGRLVPQDSNDEPACQILANVPKQLSARFLKDNQLYAVPYRVPADWVWTTVEALVRPDETVTYGILKPVWVETAYLQFA
jgi:uncharacterized protein